MTQRILFSLAHLRVLCDSAFNKKFAPRAFAKIGGALPLVRLFQPLEQSNSGARGSAFVLTFAPAPETRLKKPTVESAKDLLESFVACLRIRLRGRWINNFRTSFHQCLSNAIVEAP